MDDLRNKYLQGKLTESERQAFERNLSSEEKKELAYELGVRDEIVKRELRKKVAGFEEGNRRKRMINPTYISIAASIVLVTSSVFYFMRDEESLFDQYYDQYPNYELTTTRGEENLSNRGLAYAAYDVGDYQVAIEEFNKLEVLLAPDYFFRGVSYIQVEEYNSALSDFNEVVELEDESYGNASIWYTALVHLKLNNKDKAIPILKKLAEGESEFASTATDLIAQL
ncbi:tetratricopeptide repeat protein [Ekhidna sp. To15]|uniref:tetratricopeptide repeat protein n=1 Tax=Ekhidna sp. To15 TaxID=3395267 RepID=UPI003F52022D